jgi:hypothetical protein
MKTSMLTFALVFAFAATPALADEGSKCHFHGSKPAAESSVLGCANERKAALIKQGKLEASWSDIQPGKPEQIDGKKGKEWKLTFKNPAAKDKAKETLYMFYTLPGNFVAANHTGQ